MGLGNPGAEYAQTRHNAGFLLVERLATQWQADWTNERKFSARLARSERQGKRVLLCQPQTFMNLSGESVGALMDFYRLPLAQLIVAVDDADLPFGEIRLRPGGSSGGHHGLESIEQHLSSREFARLRIGIGRKDGARQITNHVLGRFEAAESGLLEKVLERAANQVECWLDAGLQKAMSQFNGVDRPHKRRKKVKRYEGLFILNISGKEEGVKDTLDKVSSDITAAGGKVETVQKMDKKAFARVADKKFTAGFYANIIFNGTPAMVAQLQKQIRAQRGDLPRAVHATRRNRSPRNNSNFF